MGDGGFWHNGLTSGVGNAVFNKSDNVTVIVDNGYTSATGGQDILSSRGQPLRSTGHAIEKAVRGVGVEWVRTVTHTYDRRQMRDTLKEALTTATRAPRWSSRRANACSTASAAKSRCSAKAVASGRRVVRERFGVDADTCTGDHSCIRLSGCPSLTVASPTPTRCAPIRWPAVVDSCVGCGLCGEVAHAAVLCPSFYRPRSSTTPPAGTVRCTACAAA
jgi:indolepyruvate ferredoxin oxidoreductase alpha subunit